MTADLPACSPFAADCDGYRVWKRLFRHAGKKRAFHSLEPFIRSMTPKIRNRIHPAFAGESRVPPLERKHQLLAAFDEIRVSHDLVNAQAIVDELGTFIYGTTGVALHVLVSGACLVQAMLAKRNFDLHLVTCVTELSALDLDFVQTLHPTLRVRPTWVLRTGPSGTPSLFGNRQ